MRQEREICICSTPDELQEGLFGQVLLFVLELLPFLSAQRIRPDWNIRTRHYGTVIPGTLDLAYVPAPHRQAVSLETLREQQRSTLQGDWHRIAALWQEYFVIPRRILERADAVGPLSDTLGVHYRGTDKLAAHWDTNPVSAPDFTSIIQDLLSRRPDLRQVFVATDDQQFANRLGAAIALPVINHGPVDFHKAQTDWAEADPGQVSAKADRAMLDCVLLSRCAAVLNTSSALSGFAKVLRPDLEIHRCAASKLFADVPYFPVAYIPVYQTDDPAVASILARLMAGDWREAVPGETLRQGALRLGRSIRARVRRDGFGGHGV